MKDKKPTYEELLEENRRLKKELSLSNAEADILFQDKFRKLVFESSQIPIVIMDAVSSRFIDCNPAAVSIYRFSSREETINKTPLDVSAPFQYDGTASNILAKKHIKTAIDEGTCVFEWRHKYPNGDFWDAEVHLLRFHHEGQQYLQFSLVDITDRVSAKKALLESEANLKAIIENSLESIWSIDTNYRIQYVNENFANAFFASFGNTLAKGVNILDALPDSLRTLWKDRYDRAFKNEQFTFTDKIDLGEAFLYIEVAMTPIVLDGKVVGASFYGKDITETKRYEIELIEMNSMRELIVDSIPSYIFWKDKNSVYLGCNKNFAKRAGVGTPENIVGKTDYDLAWTKEEADFFVDVDRRVMQKGIGEYRINEPQTEPNGRIAWIETNKIPLRNADGQVFGILGTFEDITERKETEEALRESRFKFKETVDLLPQVVYEADTDGRLTFINKQAFETFGYTEEDFKKGIMVRDCFAPENNTKAMANFFRKFKGGGGSNEYIAIRKDGTKFPVIIYSTPIVRNNQAIGLRGIIIDITQRKEIENELVWAKEQAEESDRLKSAFLANMSHEIRTPMNGILGFAELLKTPDLSGEELNAFVSVIEESGNRMLNIINDLINISKIEAGQMEVSITETNINEQLDFLYTFFSTETQKKQIELNTICPLSTEEATIHTDKEKLNAVLTNLIKNAIKFTNKGNIDFGYEINDDAFLFFVSDTGIGIPENKIDIIFERFVQADSSVSSGFEGSGLGLSISKGYIDLLGGNIHVESTKNKGTCFYFTLPRYSNLKKGKKTKSSRLGIEKDFNNTTILLAEDDDTSLIYLSSILKNSNVNLLTARNGLEAVEQCNRNDDIKLVLMDIKMPLLDGYSAAKKIKETKPDLCIIAQTAFALSSDRDRYGNTFCDYITKPIKSDELKQTIKKHLK